MPAARAQDMTAASHWMRTLQGGYDRAGYAAAGIETGAPARVVARASSSYR